MWRLRICPTPNPSPSRGFGFPTSAHRRAIALSIALLYLISFFVVCPVHADSPIQILSNEQSYQFSESLDFVLEVESDAPIVEVILFYGRVDIPLVRRIYPQFVAGTQVHVEYQERLESGQFAPGTLMHTWWHISAQDGTSLTTEPVTFEYTDTNQDWQLLSGARVDLHWYGRDEERAKELLATSEEAIARLEEEVGVAVEHRVRVYVYNSERDMSAALALRSEGYDDRVMTLGVAANESALLLLGPRRDVEMVIAHELSHIVVGMAADNPYTDLPRWLDEGLAMYAEGELPLSNQSALEDSIRADNLLSIRSMTSYSGQASQVDLFYGEAYSIIDYMLSEYGREAMRELLMVFAEGTRQEEALQRVYGFGLAELDARWRASLGLAERRQEEKIAATPVVEQEPRSGESPICTYSVGAVTLPLLAGALRMRERAKKE
ncbi:MAG: hypothetical protein A2Y73_02660 [Chloroflexi bacterium RBG_13_56_8]|nr:MAG: hypothetical protein A2Y73_02660 [Chloroflexi bacterium RBG_13_56_8]